MEDFFVVFEQMMRQGPGSRATTMKVFESIPDNHRIESILDVGCGKGQSSIVLAQISRAYGEEYGYVCLLLRPIP